VRSKADAGIGTDRTAATVATRNLPIEKSLTSCEKQWRAFAGRTKVFNLNTSPSVNYFT
jgi:hypothetical protein